jgi:hypothetical protein
MLRNCKSLSCISIRIILNPTLIFSNQTLAANYFRQIFFLFFICIASSTPGPCVATKGLPLYLGAKDCLIVLPAFEALQPAALFAPRLIRQKQHPKP